MASPQPPILSVYPTQKERAFWRPQPLQLLANYQAFQATKGNYNYFCISTSLLDFFDVCLIYYTFWQRTFKDYVLMYVLINIVFSINASQS